jgi:hypothetical protein
MKFNLQVKTKWSERILEAALLIIIITTAGYLFAVLFF